jgi:hypothetical protein
MPVAAPRLLPLRAPDRVVLVVDDLGAMPATVVATGADEATLLLDGTGLPARMLHRRRGAVERTKDGVRFRGEGDIVMAAGRRGRVRDDTVVFHFRAADPARPPQRRAEPRLAAVLPVTLVPLEAPVAPARALTLDVSLGGALVRSPLELDTGEAVQVHLQLPGEELPVPAAGEVVRRAGDGLLGLHIERMRPADRELVERWIASRRRDRPA